MGDVRQAIGEGGPGAGFPYPLTAKSLMRNCPDCFPAPGPSSERKPRYGGF